MTPELLQVLVDVIRTEMQLEADQVVIYNQQWVIPTDKRLYLSLNLMGSKPYANNRRYRRGIVNDPRDGAAVAVLNQEQSINMADVLSVHIMSYGGEARVRRNEVLFALHSTYAEEKMDQYSFTVGPVPSSFTDISEAVGTEILNRYAATFNLLYAQASTTPVRYFEEFPAGQTVIQP